MRARCLSYYFTESEPTVGREKRMDASDYRIAGDAHRTAGGRSNHNQYLIENPISPEAVLEKEKEFILAFIPPLQPVALSFGFIYEQNRIWIASSEVGDGNMGSAVLGRGLNIDLVSYRPSLNRLSPAGRAFPSIKGKLAELSLLVRRETGLLSQTSPYNLSKRGLLACWLARAIYEEFLRLSKLALVAKKGRPRPRSGRFGWLGSRADLDRVSLIDRGREDGSNPLLSGRRVAVGEVAGSEPDLEIQVKEEAKKPYSAGVDEIGRVVSVGDGVAHDRNHSRRRERFEIPQYRVLLLFLSLLGSCVAGFFGHFLGSEGSLIRIYVFSHVGLDFTYVFPLILAVGGGQALPLPSPSDPSSSSSFTEDSSEIGVLLEPDIVPNLSLESSLRSRIVRLEEEHTLFLLDKERGEYWAEIKTSLNQAPSQKEYNLILDFESRDLQIRERKHAVFALYAHMRIEHPDLAARAAYNHKEALMDFFEEKRDELDTHPEWSPAERDRRELQFLNEVERDLISRGPRSIYMNRILGIE
ncbi:hypothetical protein Dsin_014905 [Dipteronia sinensis]|uniref:Uncharacterized protein n=1 Tax=Dipteronia sinensis TaxID=43782 RepID=A0AAE0ANR6_9ROSI|nr:hypothetical protein Dsin_014905 [Dipteronia sinensis]